MERRNAAYHIAVAFPSVAPNGPIPCKPVIRHLNVTTRLSLMQEQSPQVRGCTVSSYNICIHVVPRWREIAQVKRMMDMPEEKNTFIHVNRTISRSAEERAAERGERDGNVTRYVEHGVGEATAWIEQERPYQWYRRKPWGERYDYERWCGAGW